MNREDSYITEVWINITTKDTPLKQLINVNMPILYDSVVLLLDEFPSETLAPFHKEFNTGKLRSAPFVRVKHRDFIVQQGNG